MRKQPNGYNKLISYRNSETANYNEKWRQILCRVSEFSPISSSS